MSIPRSILFLDGENLVMRYQDMVASGRKPDARVVHIPDVFVWHPNVIRWHDLRKVLRVACYTSVVGDDARVMDVKRTIAQNTYVSLADEGGTGTRGQFSHYNIRARIIRPTVARCNWKCSAISR